MNVYDDMENAVNERGVRVTERLKLLALLRQHQGDQKLPDLLAKHERSIEEASNKVQEVIR